jgi:hypothetical protein
MGDGVQLYPEVIEAIRQFVYSDAWERFYKPALLNMKEEWANRLMDPSAERKNQYPDDYIRGCFATIDVFLNLPVALISEHDAELERQDRERVESRGYEGRAAAGQVGPYSDPGSTPER